MRRQFNGMLRPNKARNGCVARWSVLPWRIIIWRNMSSHASLVRERRRFLAVCSTFGLSSTLFPGVLWSLADEQPRITTEMIDEAAAIAGVSIADEHKQMMLGTLN